MEAEPTTSRRTTPPVRRRRRPAALLAAAVGATSLTLAASPSPAGAITTPEAPHLVSRNHFGAPAQTASDPATNGNGRFVAFSTINPLVPADTNERIDVYVRDRWAGETELVSVSSSEGLSDATSVQPSISDDGRYVAFRSAASNWGGPATSGRWNAWVRDRVKGTTVRASIGHAGDTIGADADGITISGNGRYVAYASKAANVVSGDTNAAMDVFLRDLVTNTNERVSISVFEGQSLMDSFTPSISDDGRYVAFTSLEELAGGRADEAADVFVRDRTGGTTIIASVDSAEDLADGDPFSPRISGNGRFVAFLSKATDLVASDTNTKTDVFRRDLQAGTTIRVSVHDNDAQLGSDSSSPAISDDGSAVGFATAATAVAGTDSGNDLDVYVRTVSSGATRRVSTSSAAPDPSGTHDLGGLSDDGTAVAFRSFVAPGPALVADQPTNTQQVYLAAPTSFSAHPTVDSYVDRQYQDFLGRVSTSGERSAWQGRFVSGEGHPAQLAAVLSELPEFAGDRAPVVRLYWAFFLRKPDAGGLNYWIAKYQGGSSLAAIAQKFAQSSEFKNRYGSVSNEQYLKLVYQNVFERQPDPSGLAYWKQRLDAGTVTRGKVLVEFSESSEGKRRLAPQVHLILIPLAMLRTVPTADFFDKGLAAFKAGEDEAAWVAQQVIDSAAYAARVD